MKIKSISIPQSLEREINFSQNIETCLCIKCKTYLKHEVLTDIYHSYDEYDGILTMYYNHRILRCINCDSISYQNKTVLNFLFNTVLEGIMSLKEPEL